MTHPNERVDGHTELTHREIPHTEMVVRSSSHAHEAGNGTSTPASQRLTSNEVLAIALEVTGQDAWSFMGASRSPRHVRPRQTVMYFLHRYGVPSEEISKLLGGRDRPKILLAFDLVEERLKKGDQDVRNWLAEIARRCKADVKEMIPETA